MADKKRASSAGQIQEQKASNLSAIPHYDAFAVHRARLTALTTAGADATQRLCVLGAGNCYDLDLEQLTAVFKEVHLVDIDQAAVRRARERLRGAAKAKVFLHAPLDLTGLVDRLDRWRSFQVEPQELMEHPARVSAHIAERLPGPFDVVLSACVLSQMHLGVLNVLSLEHRLFEATRQLINLTHLRTLAKLTAPTGLALVVTDVASDEIHPLGELDEAGDHRPLLAELARTGSLVFAVEPELLAWTVGEDPMLQRSVEMSAPLAAWIWRNGPNRIFLVYAAELRPLARGGGIAGAPPST